MAQLYDIYSDVLLYWPKRLESTTSCSNGIYTHNSNTPSNNNLLEEAMLEQLDLELTYHIDPDMKP